MASGHDDSCDCTDHPLFEALKDKKADDLACVLHHAMWRVMPNAKQPCTFREGVLKHFGLVRGRPKSAEGQGATRADSSYEHFVCRLGELFPEHDCHLAAWELERSEMPGRRAAADQKAPARERHPSKLAMIHFCDVLASHLEVRFDSSDPKSLWTEIQQFRSLKKVPHCQQVLGKCDGDACTGRLCARPMDVDHVDNAGDPMEDGSGHLTPTAEADAIAGSTDARLKEAAR